MAGATPKGLVFAGCRARFSVDGQGVGYATDCNGSEEIQYEPIRVLDSIQTVEFVPIGYDVSFSAARVRLIGQPLRGPDLDIFPKLGNDPQEHLQNILNKGDLTAQIEDSISGLIFMILEQCKVSRRNWAIAARGVVGENIDFVGVRMRDESEA